MIHRLPLITGLLIGWSSLVVSGALLIATGLEVATSGIHATSLALSMGVMLVLGLIGVLGFTVPPYVRRRNVYIAVTITWFVITFLGGMPYLLAGVITNPIQAWFESTSGFTTVGSTVIVGDNLANLGYGLGFYRAATQWIGGIGIVVLAVMALPVLGAGGLELIGAEAPGPMTDKFSPRTRQNAWRIATVYVVLTFLCTVFLWWRGLTLFEALTSAFTALATGGFSVSPNSFADYATDPVLLFGLSFFMLCGASDMGIFWRAWRGQWASIWMHGELRAYVGWVALTSGAIAAFNWWHQAADPANSIFTTVSFLTTTGFASSSWEHWPMVSLILLLLVMFPGGMTGSTAGGLKILRCQISSQMLRNELVLLRRQHQIVAIRIGPGQARVSREVVRSVLSFHIGFILLWLASVIGTAAFGLDPWTSISAVTCSMATIGQTMGTLTNGDWSVLPSGVHFIHIIDMLAGRLEILPVAVTVTTIADWVRFRNLQPR